jgi:copper chaperone CopZ
VVRYALLSVKGVTRARVTLKPPEAIVNYDAAQTTVKQLIEAVAQGVHPYGINQYKAKVKTPKGK